MFNRMVVANSTPPPIIVQIETETNWTSSKMLTKNTRLIRQTISKVAPVIHFAFSASCLVFSHRSSGTGVGAGG
jgi:hypothetical protein